MIRRKRGGGEEEEEVKSSDGEMSIGENCNYSHGLFNFATHIVSDCGSSLVWCAADNGDRIKAFRAPKAIRPLSRSATCNKAENGLSLQYTLCSQAGRGDHAGLHVMGTQVICIKGESMSEKILDKIRPDGPLGTTVDASALMVL